MKELLRYSLPVLAALLISSCSSPPNDKDITALKREGETLMERIEKYAGQHNGDYPASLEVAGIKAPKTRWGPWEYFLRDGKPSVSIGKYGRDGFVLFWKSGYGWYLDT